MWKSLQHARASRASRHALTWDVSLIRMVCVRHDLHMLYLWMSHVAHILVTCPACPTCVSHVPHMTCVSHMWDIWMSHVAYVTYTYVWHDSFTWDLWYVCDMTYTCCTYEWVMSHTWVSVSCPMWMRHVAHIDISVMSHVNASCRTHRYKCHVPMNESCRTYKYKR